jgi:hypothetical protein
VLYLRAASLDPAAAGLPPGDLPAHLAGHEGQTGQVSVAFAANGVVHFWEHETDWFAEWEDLADGMSSRQGSGAERAGGAGRPGEGHRARLAAELAGALLADPQFRAAPRVVRQRMARQAGPEGTDKWAAWEAGREACDRADKMAQSVYGQFEGRLDDLVAELLASPGWQQASSPAARKQAAERFIIPHADGFRPPPLVCEELYARARQLARAARASPSGLF